MTFKIHNLSQLRERAKAEPAEWLVDQLLPVGTFNILAGKPKAGKSTLVRQLAAAVSSGISFLDRLTKKAEVLYFAVEEVGAYVADHFERLGAEEGIHTVLGSPGSDAVTRLGAALTEMPSVKLVIIDPLFKFIAVKDADKYSEMSVALDGLAEVAATHRVVILAVHHMKKRATEEVGDAMLGSSAIHAGVCTSIFLKGELKGTRTIQTSQRYGGHMASTELSFDELTNSFSLGQTTGEKQEENRQKGKQERAARVIQCVIAAPGIEQETLRQQVGCSTADLSAAIGTLINEGQLHRTGTGRKGSPYCYSVDPVEQTSPPIQEVASFVPAVPAQEESPYEPSAAELAISAELKTCRRDPVRTEELKAQRAVLQAQRRARREALEAGAAA